MTKAIFTSTNHHAQKIAQIRFRLMARLVVIFTSLTLVAQRLVQALANPDISSAASETFLSAMPFLFSLSGIVLTEYLLYRKYGLRILKYSKLVDLLFSLAFNADWVFSLHASLVGPKLSNYKYSLSAALSFTSFSWRTLMQLLITQQWVLKIAPPVTAYIYLMWFGVTHQPDQTPYILLRGIFQASYIMLIFYFEHKMNFTLMIGNVQQEQWLKLNEFILNNIPENIVIMDLEGNCNFTSEYFKKLMIRLCNSPSNIKQFFQNIKGIQRQQQDDENESSNSDHIIEMIPLRKHTTSSPRYNNSNNFHEQETKYDTHTTTSLEDLITNFATLISSGSIKDKSFQIFNGKFKEEGSNAGERSFEIKVSFIDQQPNRYILLILRDTTQRDLVLTLEGNIKYKDHLLASVSHELRTPLNGNINLIEAAIKSTDVSTKIKDNLLVPAVKSSKFLLHLINDILDMSQIKAQKLRLVFQRADLKATLGETVQLVEIHAHKKGINLDIDISNELPADFCTDHVRLSQIVLNLLNNSIKFTQKGHVKLSAWPVRESDYVRVEVQDSGIGIKEEDISKLFNDFTHINSKNRDTLNPTGVGLGLKIANDLVRLLGPKGNGGIMVDSHVDNGSTFSFIIENKESGLSSLDKESKEEVSLLVPNEFPLVTESSLAEKIKRNTIIMTRSRGEVSQIITAPSCCCAKVLAVDDDPFNMMAYEIILTSLDVKYDCAYSGRNAIDKMLNKVRYPCSACCQPYKVVFMDEEMPGMTGKETISEITDLQRQNLLPDMNIIGCTAHSNGEEIEKFLKSGIKEYLPKPISADAIKKALEKYGVIDC